MSCDIFMKNLVLSRARDNNDTIFNSIAIFKIHRKRITCHLMVVLSTFIRKSRPGSGVNFIIRVQMHERIEILLLFSFFFFLGCFVSKCAYAYLIFFYAAFPTIYILTLWSNVLLCIYSMAFMYSSIYTKYCRGYNIVLYTDRSFAIHACVVHKKKIV